MLPPRVSDPVQDSYESAGIGRLTLHFVGTMRRSLGWRLAAAVAVGAALAVGEGAGIVLLVPLLGAIGLIVTEGPIGHIAGLTTRLFALVSLEPTLPVVLLLFVTVSIASAGLYRWQMVMLPSTEQQFTVELRNRLYAAVVSARWSLLVQRRSTDLAHALTVDVERVSSAAFQLLRLLATLCVTVAYVAVAARLSPVLTAAGAVGSIVVLWLLRGRTRDTTARGAEAAEADRALTRFVHESLAGLRVTKTSAAEARAIAAHDDAARAASRGHLTLVESFARSKQRTDIISAVALSGLLLVAAGALDVRGASLLLLMLVFSRLVPRILTLQESIQVFASGLPSFRNVLTLLQRFEAGAEQHLAGHPGRFELGSRLRLESVSFAYPSADRTVVDQVDLEIRAGEVTALVGPSGGGKSTVADLIAGLLQPRDGRVLVDGMALTPDRLAAWRRSIGYVSQDPFLLHDTIRANLQWAAPGATDADLWRALAMADAERFVRALPGGLETVVGDRGARLSGGERQRIALARALVGHPTLLILDEATSALDGTSERQILEVIARLRGTVTVLIITHRLAGVRDADAIHVLDGGRIVQSGTWQALAMERAGLFRVLWDAQATVDPTVATDIALGLP